MKLNPLKAACFFLILALVSPVGVAVARQNLNDMNDYGMAYGKQQPTRLDPITACTDIDGFATPCRNQQKVRVDLAQVDTDIDGFPIARQRTFKTTKDCEILCAEALIVPLKNGSIPRTDTMDIFF